jgi:hypothetical protein
MVVEGAYWRWGTTGWRLTSGPDVMAEGSNVAVVSVEPAPVPDPELRPFDVVEAADQRLYIYAYPEDTKAPWVDAAHRATVKDCEVPRPITVRPYNNGAVA